MPILTANSGTYYPSPRHRAAADLAPLSITSPRAALVRLPPTTATAKSVVSPTSSQSAAAAAHFVGRLSPRTQRSAQRLQGSVIAPALPYEYDRRKRRASLPPSDTGHSPTTSAVLLPKLNNVAINKISNQQANTAAAVAPSTNTVAVQDTPPTTSVRQLDTNPHSQQHLSTHRPQQSSDHSRKASTSLTPLTTSNTTTNAPSSSVSSTTTSSAHNRQLSRCSCATPHSPLPRLSSYTHTHINGHSCQVYAHLTNPLHRILFIAFFTADILHTQPHRLLINVPRSLLCDKLKRDHIIRELTKHLYFTINDNCNQCELHLDIVHTSNILYNNTTHTHNVHDPLTTTPITSVSSPTAAATTTRHPTPVDTATLSTYIHRYIIQPAIFLDDTLADLTHIALSSETIDELNQRSQHSRSVSSSITHQNQQHNEHNSAPPSKHPSAMLSSPSGLPAQHLLSPTSSSAELTIMTLSLSPRSSINLMSPSSNPTAITSLDEVKLHDSIADENVLTSNRPSVQIINDSNKYDNSTNTMSPPSQQPLSTSASLPVHPVSHTNNEYVDKTADTASSISNDEQYVSVSHHLTSEKPAAVNHQNSVNKSNTQLTVNTDELQRHHPADTTTNAILSPAESTLLISPSDTAISLVSDSPTMSPQSDSSTDKSDSNLDDDDVDDDDDEQNGDHQRMSFPIIAIDKVDLPNDSPINNNNDNKNNNSNINNTMTLSTMKLSLKPSTDNTPNTSKPVSARTGNKLLDLFLPPDEDEINSLETNDNAMSVPSSARIPLLTSPYALSAATSAVSTSSLSSITLPSARPYNKSTTFDLSALTKNNDNKITNNTTTSNSTTNTSTNHHSIPTSLSSVYCGYHDSAGIYGDENIEYDDEIEMKRAALEGLYNYSDSEVDHEENQTIKHGKEKDDDGSIGHHDNQ